LNPEKYISGKLFTMLPKRKKMVHIEFPKTLSLKGFCPVTFKEGPAGFGSIISGNQNYIVRYGEDFFSFVDQEKLDKFMRYIF
jgi:adenylate/nucleoside-diphosphate kinase